MTTPENFRRRQRLEGVGLVLLGAFTIAYTVYSDARDDRQDACVTEQVQEIGEAQVQGRKLLTRDLENIKDVIAAALTAEDRAALIEARDDYFARGDKIAEDRKNHPVPEFPEGKCE